MKMRVKSRLQTGVYFDHNEFKHVWPCLIHDDVIKWKHFLRYWSFVRGIQQSLVNSLRKDQWRGDLMFSVIFNWTNSWENNGDADDLRRHHAHYDVIVMFSMKFRVVRQEDVNDTPSISGLSGYISNHLGRAVSIFNTGKPVCNDHLYNKINYLWFIQQCVLM